MFKNSLSFLWIISGGLKYVDYNIPETNNNLIINQFNEDKIITKQILRN